MDRFGVQLALENVGEARKAFDAAKKKFDSDVAFVMSRLLHEAALNRMSVEDVARYTGFTTKSVRLRMRAAGLDPRNGKTLLAKQAAEALQENSVLLGIEPHEMDLTSPLAYLPMGEKLRRDLRDQSVSQVHELDEVSGNEDGL